MIQYNKDNQRLVRRTTRPKANPPIRPEVRERIPRRALDGFDEAQLEEDSRLFQEFVDGVKPDIAPRPEHKEQLWECMLTAFEETEFQRFLSGSGRCDATPSPERREQLWKRMVVVFEAAGRSDDSRER